MMHGGRVAARSRELSTLMVAGLLLVGCVGTPPSPLEVQAESLLRQGADYAFDPHPTVSDLQTDKDTFACRYVSPSTKPGKNLVKTEADALIAGGIDIVTNYEFHTMDLCYECEAAGQTACATTCCDANCAFKHGHDNAVLAEQQALAAGMPDWRPIYFSVDFDEQPAEDYALFAYLDGAASVLGKGRVGLYSGYNPMKRSFDAGKIAFGWQAYAWSAGQWDNRAQLRQTQNGITIGACVNCGDRDWSTADDFGQWGAHTPLGPDMAGKAPADLGGSGADGGAVADLGGGGGGGGGGAGGNGGAGGSGGSGGSPCAGGGNQCLAGSKAGCSFGGGAAPAPFGLVAFLMLLVARRRAAA